MKSSQTAERVIEYVLTRREDDLASLTVDHIASSLQISRSHLSRTFKNEKKFTIEDFIFKIKIIRAAAILREKKDISIKDISRIMGFSRSDYFIRIFKLYFGTTPARYRELVNRNKKI